MPQAGGREPSSPPSPDGSAPRVRRTARATVLYDAALLDAAPPVEWFDPHYWRGQGAVEGSAGGRGTVWMLRWREHRWVLRHYRRGGMAAHLSADRYLWSGAERSRALREWRLLHRMWCNALPVPRPVAALVRRRGLSYRADLLTETIAAAEPLSRRLRTGLDRARWRAIGQMIRRFHDAGVWHADLNAHNVLLSDAGEYLIDFDRGAHRGPGGRWRRGNLARLRRSLQKIAAATDGGAIDEPGWQALLDGYGAA